MFDNVIFKLDGKVIALDQLYEIISNEFLFMALHRVVQETRANNLSRTPCPVHGKLPQVIVELTTFGGLEVTTVSCCDQMEKTVTGPLRNTLNATAYFSHGMLVKLQVQGVFSEPYTFKAHEIKKLVIGREAGTVNDPLHLDLSAHGGQKYGVSRRHAWIIWKTGALHIVDNASSNGTYLNDLHLDPLTPYKLHNGDLIRLGKLNLELSLTE